MHFLLLSVFIGLCIVGKSCYGKENISFGGCCLMKNQTLWFRKPAESWEQALPLGNGKLGAMVYGGTQKEQIDLNLDTFWSGTGKEKIREEGWKVLEKSRELVLQGKYLEAEEELQRDFLNDWNESYLPAGSLYIEESGEEGNAYKRELNMEEGICQTVFGNDQTETIHKSYISHEYDCLIVLQHKKTNTTWKISMESPFPYKIKKQNENEFYMIEQAPSRVYPNYYECEEAVQYDPTTPGMLCCLMLRIYTDGEISRMPDGKWQVKDATKLRIHLTGETGYDKEKNLPVYTEQELCIKCREKLEKLENVDWEEVERTHRAYYKNVMQRVILDLGGELPLPTDERLYSYQKEQGDTGIFELWYQLGRYLLVSSSVPGSMAANLQGIWNREVRPPWSSNYTTNINVEMNYWMAESANLSEYHEPMFDLIRDCLDSGRKTAHKQFGCRGWTLNHNIDLWRQTSPVGSLAARPPVKYGYFPVASGWLCRHIWEHYLYTEDKIFLEKWYPIMKEAAEFYLDYLVENNGYYVTAPSTSPENQFYDENGNLCAVSVGSTMDTAIIRTLFLDCIQAEKVLGQDSEVTGRIRKVIPKLLPYRVNQYGGISEWSENFREALETHRHLSHLYGLYPASDLDTDTHVELRKACIITLNRRTDEGPGWSKAWKACLWSRLREGERAWSILNDLLTPVTQKNMSYTCGGSYGNLLCAHPPFQIDGNFGAAAAITEMLVQSHKEYIELLPALPRAWKDGSLKGICVRGGFELQFSWKDMRVVNVNIQAKLAKVCKIKINGKIYCVKCEGNKNTNVEI